MKNESLSNINRLKNYYSIELILFNIEMTDIENLNNIFYNIKNLTINFKNNYYVQGLFSFGNIITNLVYLNLEGHLEYKINPYLFEYINDLKFLEYLFLSYC